MRERRRSMGIGIGGASILAIFVVLCLTTFAMLSLVSARADARLAERSIASQRDYYNADGKAEEMLGKMAEEFATGGDWQKKADEEGIVYVQTAEGWDISFTLPINEGKILKVRAALWMENGSVQVQRRLWRAEPRTDNWQGSDMDDSVE
ncbi:hypothetical protein LJC20_01730 [Eubacteriales bacterium OttesenSCG-928-M02]|nr:hypothetical protein [Eubacteriales bacterium OttesenSCG-928-M02]